MRARNAAVDVYMRPLCRIFVVITALMATALLAACRERASDALVATRLPAEPLRAVVTSPLLPREVLLWPANSEVLQHGVRELTGKENAVTHPSLLFYGSRGPSARTAVLVFPGGGFKALAIGEQSTLGSNGADVCKWLTNAGATCILVKYRVPNTACNWNRDLRRHEQPDVPMALQDTQRAISLVRHRARDYGIDPRKIGVMGFSAGGNLAVLASTAFAVRSYEPIDAVDAASNRPDFAIPVYPGHLTMEHKNKLPKALAAGELNTDITVSGAVPPTLLIHARDDQVDPVHYSEVYATALRRAGTDVTLNIYETGGHAFGVKKQGKATDLWMDDAIDWMKGRKLL